MDVQEGRANPFAAPGGLHVADLEAAARVIAERAAVGAVALTAYDPTCDQEGRVRRGAEEVLPILVGL